MFNLIEQIDGEIDAVIFLVKRAFGWRPNGPEDIDDEFWGECPICGGNDRFLNVQQEHWFVCHQHRIRWYGGKNVFGTWRHQTAADWRANARLLSCYRETKDPVFWCRRAMTPARVRSVRDVPAQPVLIESRGDE